jgi:hypothetical protein
VKQLTYGLRHLGVYGWPPVILAGRSSKEGSQNGMKATVKQHFPATGCREKEKREH